MGFRVRLAVIVILLGLAAPASADSGSAEPVPTAGSGETIEPKRKIDPTQIMRERQQIEMAGGGGRSGFWTSRQPAKGGAYRWRLLGIGLGLIVLTGGVIMYLIRRANRSNKSRPDHWASRRPPPETPAHTPDEPKPDNPAPSDEPSTRPPNDAAHP